MNYRVQDVQCGYHMNKNSSAYFSVQVDHHKNEMHPFFNPHERSIYIKINKLNWLLSYPCLWTSSETNKSMTCNDRKQSTARQRDCKEVLEDRGAVEVEFERVGAQHVFGVCKSFALY